MKKLIISMVSAAVIICGLFAAPATKADDGKRVIAISPMSQKIILTPGETYSGGFTVANPANATENLNYLVTVGPYYPEASEERPDDYGSGNFTDYTNMNMMTDWITILNPTGTIAPNGNELVKFTIDVPENAPAGGQYASLLVKENRDAKAVEDSAAVTEVMQMAHLLYAEIAGETINEGAILENNIPSFLLNNELKATSMVQNNGNIHTDAEYVLQVWPLFSDEELCTNEEEPDINMVFPNTKRYHEQLCQLPSVGIFKAKQMVKIFGETSIVEKTVIVCPIWLLFIILAVIAGIIIWIVMRVRARGKKSRKTQTKDNE